MPQSATRHRLGERRCVRVRGPACCCSCSRRLRSLRQRPRHWRRIGCFASRWMARPRKRCLGGCCCSRCLRRKPRHRAAMEVHDFAPGASVLIDADALAFPQGFSKLAPGDYDVQAVLDVDDDYNYSGRGAGDLVSDVTAVPFDSGASVPTLRLTRALTDAPQPWKVPEQVPAKQREQLTKRMQAAQPHSRALDFVSPALSAFWGRPIHVRGWVLLPPGYRKNANAHYPAVYFTHGFGGELAYLTSKAADVWSDMADG